MSSETKEVLICLCAGVFIGSLMLETLSFTCTGSFRQTQPYKVIAKKDNFVTMKGNRKNETYVLTFDQGGHDSIVYNNINVGDKLRVQSLTWSEQKQFVIPNAGWHVKRINGKAMDPQLCEYDRQKELATKMARENFARSIREKMGR